MPMNFPDMDSLKNTAAWRGFRQPQEGETEQQYRQAFYNFMVYVDSVEASEIRSGVGWDKQSPMSVLSAFADKSNAPNYVWQLAILENDPAFFVNLRTTVNSRGRTILEVDYVDPSIKEKYSEEYVQQYTAKFTVKHVMAEPKGFECIANLDMCGEAIKMLQHVKTGEVYTVVASKTFAIAEPKDICFQSTDVQDTISGSSVPEDMLCRYLDKSTKVQ